MLREAGVDHVIAPPPIDDAVLPERLGDPAGFTMAMALFKASQVQPAHVDGWVLAADTMAHDGSALIGKPRDRVHARDMLAGWRGGAHDVWTGVALLQPSTGRRWIFADRARVTLGDLADEALDAYLESDAWQGKAGAYNYADRLDAGWPLACEGDPCTVMGLPMRRLAPFLVRLAAPGGSTC
ncbi:MAG: Maf-like protein YhdE [Planctomycetota bacterium]|jgi:septum formation protein